MKKFLEVLVIVVVVLGISLGFLAVNPQWGISQKILPMFTTSNPTAEQTGTVQTTGIDLTNCVSYFDGCNNCSVKDGKADACTEMYCETPSEPKCLEYTTTGSESTDSESTDNIVKNITPTEFSIIDSKYEISLQGKRPLLSFFQDTDVGGSEFDDMVVDSDPQCKLLDQNSTKYLEKIAYYNTLFSKYSRDDVVKIYLIVDKTLRDPGVSTDEFEGEGMKIFVMPNKIGYTSLASFEKDFTQNCEINSRSPTLLSSNYLIFFGGCGGGAGEPFGCKEIMNTIKDKIIVN